MVTGRSMGLRGPWAMPLGDLVDLEARVRETRLELAGEAPGASLAMDGGDRIGEYLRVRGDVAIVEVVGPLVRWDSFFAFLFGATPLDLIVRSLSHALADPQIRRIVLQIDSPGGEVAGVDELSELIYRSRGSKPIEAHISGMGASGAYWIASAADRIVASPTALVGSIGAVWTISKEEEGDRVQFVSAASPLKRADPESEAGAASYQRAIDRIGEEFVASVARHRGVTAAEVRERYGGGAILAGRDAEEAGLVDELGLIEDVIQGGSMSTDSGIRAETGAAAGEPSDAGDTVSTAAELAETYPELVQELQATARAEAEEGLEGMISAARAEGRREAVEILELDAGPLADLRAELAADPTVSVEAAALQLLRKRQSAAADAGAAHLAGRATSDPRVPADSRAGADDAPATLAEILRGTHQQLNGRGS